MSFRALVVPHHEGPLRHYESLDLRQCSGDELLAAAREAWALRIFLSNLVEVGYTDTEALLRERTGAADRLQRFLAKAVWWKRKGQTMQEKDCAGLRKLLELTAGRQDVARTPGSKLALVSRLREPGREIEADRVEVEPGFSMVAGKGGEVQIIGGRRRE